MFHYVMVQYSNDQTECASTYRPTFAECVDLVRLIERNNKEIINVWIESSETELMECEQ